MSINVRENTCDLRLQAPFSLCIFGCSKSGKSTLACELIKNRATWINGPINRVIYCYSYLSKQLSALKAEEPDNIVLVDNLEDIDSQLVKHCLVILDDGLSYMDNKKYVRQITDYFTKRIHHELISVCLIGQNPFYNPSMRTISINSDLLVLFNSPRNKGTVINIARDFAPHNGGYVLEAFKKAVQEKPHAFLVFDFTQKTPDRFRLRDRLYPSADMQIFVPK